MLLYDGIMNSKINIIKITIILLLAHIYRCNTDIGNICGNYNWTLFTFGLIMGFMIHNLFLYRIVKSIPFNTVNNHNMINNIVMYISILFTKYYIIDIFNDNYNVDFMNYVYIVIIMSIINILFNLIKKNKPNDNHKNYDKQISIFNSVSTNIFIILIDSMLYYKQFNISMMVIYIISFFEFLLK